MIKVTIEIPESEAQLDNGRTIEVVSFANMESYIAGNIDSAELRQRVVRVPTKYFYE